MEQARSLCDALCAPHMSHPDMLFDLSSTRSPIPLLKPGRSKVNSREACPLRAVKAGTWGLNPVQSLRVNPFGTEPVFGAICSLRISNPTATQPRLLFAVRMVALEKWRPATHSLHARRCSYGLRRHNRIDYSGKIRPKGIHVYKWGQIRGQSVPPRTSHRRVFTKILPP